jgi:hypothetical protein
VSQIRTRLEPDTTQFGRTKVLPYD